MKDPVLLVWEFPWRFECGLRSDPYQYCSYPNSSLTIPKPREIFSETS